MDQHLEENKGADADKIVPSLVQGESAERKRRQTEAVKPRVTWDEVQLAEHDKTRGQKMKIDEPKTPYVTEEEFQRLCAEDPDYQKEFGHLKDEIVRDAADINSQEADVDMTSDKAMNDELQLAQKNMKVNMNIDFGEQFVNSDDEFQNQSPGKEEEGFNNQKKKFHMSTVQKKHQSMIG